MVPTEIYIDMYLSMYVYTFDAYIIEFRKKKIIITAKSNKMRRDKCTTPAQMQRKAQIYIHINISKYV